MRRLVPALLLTLICVPAPALRAQAPSAAQTLRAEGLTAPVEILRDRWGINHIYAENQADLFFAQGYAAARDRLFQFELWRRQATGTVAEILGPDEVDRDRGTRLFLFRGDLERELAYYHPDGVEIFEAYVAGVNAWIAETERDPSLLPIEFELLGIEPGRWTPDVVISRHQGLLGNIGAELSYGRAVHAIGADRVRALEYFHPVQPGDPDLTLDPAIDGSLLSQDILRLYNAFRRGVQFRPEHIVDPALRNRADADAEDGFEQLAAVQSAERLHLETEARADIGSNNWIVDGTRSLSGFPMMANDPHRAQGAPSLRYWVHLVAPGWDVIGGGEPTIPGVSIGHNQHGAWGLTVFSTDGEDLYVYETNPSDPDQYRYQGRWEDMRVIVDTIRVKGAAPEVVELKYTRHGPVVHEDPSNQVAYAVRAAWMEIGGAPYMASLRMDQARTWEEFVEASNYLNIPGENMIWAGRDGTIGWQAVGIAPIRRTWSGLVPVPGDGRYEWDGYLPIKSKPHVVNPPEGYFGTANSNLTALDYPHRREAIGWEWADPFRWARVNEVLDGGRKFSIGDMMLLQTDYTSIPARTLVPLLREVSSSNATAETARRMLLNWGSSTTRDPESTGPFVLDPTSIEAGIYVAWERALRDAVREVMTRPAEREHVGSLSLKRTIDWLIAPPGEFGRRDPAVAAGRTGMGDPIAGRDAVLVGALEEAVASLRNTLGSDMKGWRYGQERYKHALIRHPLSAAVNADLRARLDVGPAPRGGDGSTVGATGGGNNQTSGASFRIIVDTENWDNAVGTNTPGQAGDPDDPHYRDLFPLWAADRYFPVAYSRERVESVTERRERLVPR
ncbi:MAG: penicillin acylase family protein [Gemmatimonadota bacterium]|nr:penicillin acylase family protein [Gemmatimonadota bacterium]